MSVPTSVRTAVEDLVRQEWGRLNASLIKSLGDFQLAEDSLQDAIESALAHWSRNELPTSPFGWVLQVARRKAIDRLRRGASFAQKQAEYEHLLRLDQEAHVPQLPETLKDERLRLIFTCCHPAIEERARVGLTLRTLGGLTTREIARAFLVSEQTMAQRLVRAKSKITKAGIPYEVPDDDLWPERLPGVLQTIYLIFNEGYASTAGDHPIRFDLCDEATRLARVMLSLRPDIAECEGLLCLMLLNHARRDARTSANGDIVLLEDQDRALWDRDMIAEGLARLQTVLRRGEPGPYQLQAAISAIHSEARSFEETDWAEIALIYNALFEMTPNPVLLLNQAVAISYSQSVEAAFARLEQLQADLDDYQPFYAAKADFLQRAGRCDEAKAAYERAISLSTNQAERHLLQAKLSNV
ncbi:MAG: RNA polymerase sigma factor [Pseudomonadota bacterium]